MNQSPTNPDQKRTLGRKARTLGLAVLLVAGISLIAWGAVFKPIPQGMVAATDSALLASLDTLHNSALQPAERMQAARWLGGRNNDSSNLLQSLSRSLQSDLDPTVRSTVAGALADVATRSKKVSSTSTASTRSPEPQILEILESAYNAEKNASVRRAIVEAAAVLDCAEASNFITRAAADKDPAVQEAARDARLKRDQRMRSRMMG